jgi:hypothetical protein
MDIPYPLLIAEDIAQLQAAEKAARDKIRADRIRMLRFLKEGRASAGRRRCWAIMCEPFNAGGNAIAKAAWRRCWRPRSDVARRSGSRRRPGRVCRRRCGAAPSAGCTRPSSICATPGTSGTASMPFPSWRKTKLKTGRPHHRKAVSPAEQAAFKK